MNALTGGIRVAHLVPKIFGRDGVVGGAERYAYELARSMARHVPTKLVTFGSVPAQRRDGSLEIHVLGPHHAVRGQNDNPIARGLRRELRSANVIHCHQRQVVASSLAAIYARLSGRRVFVSDLGGGGWDISGYINTDSWYHGHLHISEYSRSVLRHTARSNARVILGGVDTLKFSPNPAEPRSRTVLYVGRILPHKGIDTLVRALPAELELEIIGSVKDERYLRDLHEFAKGKQVRFRYDVEDDEVIRAYRRALCVVLPSVYRTIYGAESRVPELLGQTLLEGMACRTPAICTNVASMPEIVIDGQTGFIVPEHDVQALAAKLDYLRTHPGEVERMGGEARRRIEDHFTWDRVVERCLNAYSEAERGGKA